MPNNEQEKKAYELAKTISDALNDKKGVDVTILEVGRQTVLADYFVIATGTSNTHVRALADECEFQTKQKLNVPPNHVEGFGDDVWTLLDYGTVIAHIFTKDGREFYKLEKLWKDAEAQEVIAGDVL